MRASVLGILQRVLQAYSSPLSTLLSAQEPGPCGHQQDLFLGSTTKQHQQETRDGRVALGQGLPEPLDRRSQICLHHSQSPFSRSRPIPWPSLV